MIVIIVFGILVGLAIMYKVLVKYHIGYQHHEKKEFTGTDDRFDRSPIMISFVDFIMMKIWYMSFRFDKKTRGHIMELLRKKKNSYLKTNGYLNDGFIYKYEAGMAVLSSDSFKEFYKNKKRNKY